MFKPKVDNDKTDCVTVSFRLPIAHHKKIKEMARKNKVTVSFLCRQMVKYCIEGQL